MDRYDEEKKIAAHAAAAYVTDNMVLGVGSGTTVKYFIDELAEKVKSGLKVTAVPTSKTTRQLCENYGIACIDGAVPEHIDLTVDGADEFDPCLNLIKGGGGCLLWEKIVASASEREIIIADSRKKTDMLGSGFRLPVEVIPYALNTVQSRLESIFVSAEVRKAQDGSFFVTDEGNYILDCETGGICNVEALAQTLSAMPGVVEHGLFIHMASMVLEGRNGAVYKYTAQNPVITETKQKSTFEQINETVQEYRANGAVPVIELDLDLTTFVPAGRTVLALKAAGEKYKIKEFVSPAFDLLPGYTREAWANFISRNKLAEKYPALRWMGEKDGKDGDSVYSAFHTAFWNTEYLKYDTLTAGLAEFVEKMQKIGAVVVFVSGRWKEEQIAPTKKVLEKGGLGNLPLLIGNPRHDGENPISDSEVKALHQPEIREKYGVPAVVIDDRKENRDAICTANPNSKMLSVGCAISGFTFDEETTGVEWSISDFRG